jgi:hypothetical protein
VPAPELKRFPDISALNAMVLGIVTPDSKCLHKTPIQRARSTLPKLGLPQSLRSMIRQDFQCPARVTGLRPSGKNPPQIPK